MTHHDGDTPTNGTDRDSAHARHWFRFIYDLETPWQRRLIELDDLDDEGVCIVHYPVVEQEHEELVSRLIREGEALRTELGLPGFPSEDAPPSTRLTGTPEEPPVDHADGAVHATTPAPAHDGDGHHTRRRYVVLRFGRSRTLHTRQIQADEVLALHAALIQASAARTRTRSPWRRVRLGRAETTLLQALETGLVRDERYTAREHIRRMVMRRKADLVLCLCLLSGSIVLAGNVAFSVPAWFSTGSLVLLPAAVAWWRYLREDLHEPGLDQHPAPHQDDRRT